MTQTIQKTEQNYNLVPYKIDDTKTIDVTQIKDDVWLTQKQMAQLFETNKRTISYHLQNIFESQELDKNSVVQEIWTTANDGKQYNVAHYNLDAIISVGYRVNSKRGIMFRQWATKIIKDKIKQEYENRNSHKNTTVPQLSEKKERAKLIKDLLFKKGITQKQIAQSTGFAESTVSDVINGKYKNPIIFNWFEINLFSEQKKQNPFFEKAKALFDKALQGNYSAYKKVKKILKAVSAVHDFN